MKTFCSENIGDERLESKLKQTKSIDCLFDLVFSKFIFNSILFDKIVLHLNSKLFLFFFNYSFSKKKRKKEEKVVFLEKGVFIFVINGVPIFLMRDGYSWRRVCSFL